MTQTVQDALLCRGAPRRFLLALCLLDAACDDAAEPDTLQQWDGSEPAGSRRASPEELTRARQDAELAQAAFVGEVASIQHRSAEPDAHGFRWPFTYVTWQVIDGLKGVEDGATFTARFVGGPLEGDAQLRVSEVPRFSVGDTDLVFIANNGEVGCPLVGCADGRVPLDTGEGAAPSARGAAWAADVAEAILDKAAAPARSVAADASFRFEPPRGATREELEQLGRRAQASRAQSFVPDDGQESEADRAERAALIANGLNPVLAR
jgi:hypothetical protein